MSSDRQVGAKSTREQAVPASMADADDHCVDAQEVLSAIMPMPPTALWMIMFENGTWIKRGLDILNRILPDVVVFSIDFTEHEVEDGKGGTTLMSYFYLTLRQQLRDKNGVVIFQYPLHFADLSPKYIESEKYRVDALAAQGIESCPGLPTFACVLLQLLGSLRNSNERLPTGLADVSSAPDAGSNQSKLVTLALENDPEVPTQMISVKPLSTNPFSKGASRSKYPVTTMFPSIDIGQLLEDHTKSHSMADRGSSRSQSKQFYQNDVDLSQFDFSWSVHNIQSAEMNYILTKTIVAKQPPREASASAGSSVMSDGDIISRFRIFAFEDAAKGIARTLVFNVYVFNQNTKQMFDVRFPTQMMVVKPEDEETERRQLSMNDNNEKLYQSLLRRVRFTRFESPAFDDDLLSRFKPHPTQVLFDEFYAARTLANFFSSGGTESVTLYFGFKKGHHGRMPVDATGTLLIEVNRVAVDDRIAQLMILVNPMNTEVHTSLERTPNVSSNPNPFSP